MARRDEVFDFLGDLAEVRTVACFHDLVLPGLASLVPADLWGFNDIDARRRQVVALTWPEPGVPEPHASALGEVIGEHPILRHFQQTGDGAACRISDFWTPARLHASELYRRAYGPVGVEHQVGFSLADGPTASTTFFAANRRDRDFEDGELALLDSLRRHLHAAWRRSHAGPAVDALVASESTLAVVVLDERRRVRVVGDAADKVLRRAGVTVEVGTGAPEPLASWARRARVGGDPLTLRGLTIQAVAGGPDVDLVLAVGVDAPDGPSSLSPRERAVLEVVAAGASTAEVAAQLGISARTVQKHLERIYGKLGVRNRTAAAAEWSRQADIRHSAY